MREALEELNDELERELGVRLAIRTGVNTGEVVAGDPSRGQTLATGDAVNVAARLQQAAAAGRDARSARETHRLVRDAVARRGGRAARRQGKAASRCRPGGCSSVLAGRAPPFARRSTRRSSVARRSSTRCERRPSAALRERACTLVTVVGAAGDRQVAARPRTRRRARGRGARRSSAAASPTARASPTGRSRRSCGSWPAPTTAAAARRAGRRTRSAATIAALIAGAIGASEGAARRRRSPGRSASCSRRSRAERPLVVVFDDIHWAEPTLLDLLEYVAGFSSGAPMMLLCLARPDLFDGRPAWAAPRPNTTLVSLAPLSDDEAKSLIERLLRRRELNERTGARIVEAAEGNPLFVEQMLAMQAEGPGDEHRRPADDPGAARGPHRPARARGAGRARARVGRGEALPPRSRRRAPARPGARRDRRRS